MTLDKNRSDWILQEFEKLLNMLDLAINQGLVLFNEKLWIVWELQISNC